MKKVSRVLGFTLVSTLVALAIVTSKGIPMNVAWLSEKVSGETGFKVKVGSASITLDKGTPALIVKNVMTDGLRAQTVDIRFDWASILHGNPKVRYLKVSDLKIDVVENDNGWRVFPKSSVKSSGTFLMDIENMEVSGLAILKADDGKKKDMPFDLHWWGWGGKRNMTSKVGMGSWTIELDSEFEADQEALLRNPIEVLRKMNVSAESVDLTDVGFLLREKGIRHGSLSFSGSIYGGRRKDVNVDIQMAASEIVMNGLPKIKKTTLKVSGGESGNAVGEVFLDNESLSRISLKSDYSKKEDFTMTGMAQISGKGTTGDARIVVSSREGEKAKWEISTRGLADDNGLSTVVGSFSTSAAKWLAQNLISKEGYSFVADLSGEDSKLKMAKGVVSGKKVSMKVPGGWPSLSGGEAVATFNMKGVNINVIKGRMGEIDVTGGAQIQEKKGKWGIAVNAEGAGGVNGFAKLLNTGAAGAGASKAGDLLSGSSGKATAKLSVNGAFDDERPEVGGSWNVFLPNGLRSVKETSGMKISMDGVFSDKEVSFRGKGASKDGVEIEGNGKANENGLSIAGTSKIRVERLLDLTKKKAPVGGVLISKFNVEAKSDTSWAVRAEGDGKDLTIGFPKPLEKSMEELSPWVLTARGKGSEISNIEMLSESRVNLLHTKEGAALGMGRASRPEITEGWFSVSADMDETRLEEWSSALKGISGESTGEVRWKMDGRFGRLLAGGADFGAVQIQGMGQSDQTSLLMNGERLSGAATISEKRILARLSNLTFFQEDSDVEDQGQGWPKDEWPELNVEIERFNIGKYGPANISIRAQPEDGSWLVKELIAHGAGWDVNGHGVWSRASGTTRVDFQSKGDLAEVSKVVGKEGMISGDYEMQGSASWPGGPGNFSASRISGDMTFKAKNGNIEEIEPGAGRLLSLISLQSLPRRIFLDFKDVFSKGTQFNEMGGGFKIKDGEISTNEPFVLSSPIARVALNGKAHLATGDLDGEVRIKPSMSSAGSAAAFAAGPAAGVAAWVAWKVLGNPLDSLFEKAYVLNGTLDDPKASPLKK